MNSEPATADSFRLRELPAFSVSAWVVFVDEGGKEIGRIPGPRLRSHSFEQVNLPDDIDGVNTILRPSGLAVTNGTA